MMTITALAFNVDPAGDDVTTSSAFDSTSYDALIVYFEGETYPGTWSISDSQGNTWNALTRAENNNANFTASQLFWCNLTGTSSTHTVTITSTGTEEFRRLHVWGVTASEGIELVAGQDLAATGTGSSLSAGTLATDGEAVLVYGANLNQPATHTGPSGWTTHQSTNIILASRVVTAAGNYSASSTADNSGEWAAVAAAFQAVGGEAIEGSLSATLGALTLVAAGTLEVQGSLAVTLAPLTLTAAASLAIDAELDQTLGPLVLESTGQLLNPISGALEVTLGALALHSAGQLSVTGSLEQTLAPLSMVAEGRLEIIASLDRILGDLTLTAEGSLENAIHGALEVVLGALALHSAGSLRITGALDVTLGALVLQAVGSLDGYDSGYYIDGRTQVLLTNPYAAITVYSTGAGAYHEIAAVREIN